MLGQDRLEPIFHDALARLGCAVELGTELISFTQTDDHVEAKLRVKGMDPDSEGVEEIASFDYMVGTDGARGVVRKQLGLPFVGETRTVENFVVGDIKVEGLSSKALHSTLFLFSKPLIPLTQYWHMWGNKASTMYVFLSHFYENFSVFSQGEPSGNRRTRPLQFSHCRKKHKAVRARSKSRSTQRSYTEHTGNRGGFEVR